MAGIKYEKGQAYEVVEDCGTKAYYPDFLLQIFNEYDGENINLLAYNYRVSERTMGRILKATYLYIRNERPDIVKTLSQDDKEKLIEMQKWDNVKYVPSQLEKNVRRYLKRQDFKKADLYIKDQKKSGTIEINIKKR